MERLTTAGFHHITMVTGNARRSLAFYRDVLGLRLVKKTVTHDDPGAYHLFFGDAQGRPGTLLTLMEQRGVGEGRPGIGGIHHTALGVETEDGLLRWKRRLTDLGRAVSGPYDRGYFTSLYFRDPDGQILEIATRGPGYAIDEPADALGGELKLPPQRIVRGHRDEAAIASLSHSDPVPEITPDMALTGIHHVSGITDDLERAGDFYEAALGLKLIKKTTNRDDPRQLHYFWANYRDGEVAPHSSFTLFGWPSEWNRTREGVGQTHHVAFRASSAEEQAAWVDHLRSIGVEVSSIVDQTYFSSAFFRAPDGLLLEIATDGPGLAVDEDPAALGERVALPPGLEPYRERVEASLSGIE